MKKYPIFFTFCYFILFSFGRAADWAPDSLEGKFLKAITETEEMEITLDENETYTIPHLRELSYAYIENGSMYLGFNKEHMQKQIFFTYNKTGPNNFELDYWMQLPKLSFWKASVVMINDKQATGTIYPVINLAGHPSDGQNPYGIVSKIEIELLDSKPTLPTPITTGSYSDQSDWLLSENIDINSSTKYDFKYLVPTNQNWSVEWISDPSSDDSLISVDSSEGGYSAQISGSSSTFAQYEWSPFSTGFDELYMDWNIINSSSKDLSKKTKLRAHFKAEGKQFIAEIDEDMDGNWRTFIEGSLDSGLSSIFTFDRPAFHFSFGENPLERNNLASVSVINAEISDYLNYLNEAFSSTESFVISSFKPETLTFAVGEDTLDDISSASKADFATAGSDIGGGWRSLDWFGYYYATTAGWLYHLNHGWIYPVVTSFESVWFYSPTHDWLWTTQTAYPWTWFHTGQSWKYYISSTNKWVSN